MDLRDLEVCGVFWGDLAAGFFLGVVGASASLSISTGVLGISKSSGSFGKFGSAMDKNELSETNHRCKQMTLLSKLVEIGRSQAYFRIKSVSEVQGRLD